MLCVLCVMCYSKKRLDLELTIDRLKRELSEGRLELTRERQQADKREEELRSDLRVSVCVCVVDVFLFCFVFVFVFVSL